MLTAELKIAQVPTLLVQISIACSVFDWRMVTGNFLIPWKNLRDCCWKFNNKLHFPFHSFFNVLIIQARYLQLQLYSYDSCKGWTEGLFAVRLLVKSHNLKFYVSRLLGRLKLEIFFLQMRYCKRLWYFFQFQAADTYALPNSYFCTLLCLFTFTFMVVIFLFKKFLESVAFLHLLLHKNVDFSFIWMPVEAIEKIYKKWFKYFIMFAL